MTEPIIARFDYVKNFPICSTVLTMWRWGSFFCLLLRKEYKKIKDKMKRIGSQHGEPYDSTFFME